MTKSTDGGEPVVRPYDKKSTQADLVYMTKNRLTVLNLESARPYDKSRLLVYSHMRGSHIRYSKIKEIKDSNDCACERIPRSDWYSWSNSAKDWEQLLN